MNARPAVGAGIRNLTRVFEGRFITMKGNAMNIKGHTMNISRPNLSRPNPTAGRQPAPSRHRQLAVLGAAALTVLLATPPSRAESPEPVPPPLAGPKADYFREHPEAWANFLSQLPRRPAGAPQATHPRQAPTAGGTWTLINHSPPAGICNPLLLTDGSVIAANCNTPDWYKLTPDNTGSYVNGTWTQIASLPVIGGKQYQPQYHASAVLPDGRVIINGGEYNGSNVEAMTSQGAIYDPVANQWTPVAPPSGTGWASGVPRSGIGDAASVVLADGTYLLGAAVAYPDVDALFDATTLGWTSTGAPLNTYQDEQGYTLLPNGNVLTVDVWGPGLDTNTTAAEQYDPATGKWISAGNTPVPLADPAVCGNWEIGPAVLRGDGTVVAFGGNTGCTKELDPIAIYDSAAGTWSAGPNVPAVCGTDRTTACTLADAPAVLLPNGNILYAASVLYKAPTEFFEFTTANESVQVASPQFFSTTSPSYYYNFLILPNGQIMETEFSQFPEFYTPSGSPVADWAPVISADTVPANVAPGATYQLTGLRLSGVSQGAMYGDDVQGATNYPIVTITNDATGHVFFAKTTGFLPGVSANATRTTNFTVPAGIETGAGTIVVTANGISSAPVALTVGKATLVATTTSLSASPTTAAAGTPVSLTALVKPATGSTTPTGSVSFANGSTTLGTATLNGTGQASFTTTKLPVGTDSITASYSGSTTDQGSTSSAVKVTITAAAIATKTVLTASPTSADYGAKVELTATVTQSSGTTVPQGTVTFKNGATTLGTATLTSAGKASLSVADLPEGGDSITAVYAGDATDKTSTSSAVKVTIAAVTTSTTLVASPTSAKPGAKVVLTATVKPSSGTAVAAGKVTFKSGTSTLGAVTLGSKGTASLTVTTLAAGKHSITAVYAGDSDDKTSTSKAVTVTIT